MDNDLRNELFNKAKACFVESDFVQASTIFNQILLEDPLDWNVRYLIGQCYRYLNDYPKAISNLNQAVDIKSDESSIFLALGIAYQLNGNYAESIDALRKGIDLDPENEIFYNSLAMTQKINGELDKALKNYQTALTILAQRIVKNLNNYSSNPIYPHMESKHNLWVKCTLDGALYLTVSQGTINSVSFPSGDTAADESVNHHHKGLLWVDTLTAKGELTRYFLPNYFSTFFVRLTRDSSYFNIIGNTGTVLELLGNHEDSQKHFEEASYFMSLFNNDFLKDL